MQALKAIVIFLGILILAGTTVVAVTIVKRLGGTAETSTESGAEPRAVVRPAGFGEASVAIPEGCRVEALDTAGERLVLRLGSGGRCEQILILDMATGSLLGRLTLAPAAE